MEDAFSSCSEDFKSKIEARLNDWRNLLSILNLMGVGGFVKVDMGIVRGLAYYTGFVFEAFQTVGTGRALAGGGRYDALVKKLGYPDMCAVGFGMGDVTVGDLLELTGKLPQTDVSPDAYAIIGSQSLLPRVLPIIFELRRSGVKVDYPFKISGFGKQFKMADAVGAKFAVIFGEDELAKNSVKIKDLKLGTETEVEISKLLPFFQK